MPGLLILFAIAAALITAILTIMLIREARRPPRRTAGWAVARGQPCDPGDLAMPFDGWLLDRGGGVTLPVWDIRLREPGAATLTAIIVHGWGRSRVAMLERVPPWRAWCDRVILYDLRGHGDATGGPSDLGCGEEEDLLALVEPAGEGPILLVGFSMGAVIAIHAAGRDDPRVERIAGVIAYAPYDDFHRSLRGRLTASGLPVRPLTALAMTWFRLRGLRHRRTAEAAARLRCPLLVVHGARDDICPIEEGRVIADAAPDGRIHVIADAHHGDVFRPGESAHDEAIAAFGERGRESLS